MNVNEIIKWCNENIGFLTAVLSFLTLFFSVIAIIVSINTSRLPYKKKLLVNVGSFIGVGFDSYGIHVTITNIGNRNIIINKIGLLIGKKLYQNKNTILEKQINLSIGESTSQYFESSDLKTIKDLKKNFKVYGYVEDTEGKKYKKFCCRLKKI